MRQEPRPLDDLFPVCLSYVQPYALCASGSDSHVLGSSTGGLCFIPFVAESCPPVGIGSILSMLLAMDTCVHFVATVRVVLRNMHGHVFVGRGF